GGARVRRGRSVWTAVGDGADAQRERHHHAGGAERGPAQDSALPRPLAPNPDEACAHRTDPPRPPIANARASILPPELGVGQPTRGIGVGNVRTTSSLELRRSNDHATSTPRARDVAI